MQVNAYVIYNGQCEEAFRFYERCLNGKLVTLMTFAGTPAEQQAPPEWRNKVLHAQLSVGDGVLMGSDAPPGRYEKPAGFSISLQMKDTAEAERIFHALAENGSIKMPIQQTFWAARFGMLVDRFGTPWMINSD
ncbi:MAG TPA: VOC family protein [Bryobacteraceae bacterium]|nr:VOC family protein [Bryobacteraceae bacterium]